MKNMKIGFLVCMFTVLGCHPSDTNSTGLQTLPDFPVPEGRGSWMWADPDFEEIVRIKFQKRYYSDADPLAIKAQRMIDALDQSLRTAYLKELSGVPGPKAKIYPNPAIAGSASGGSICMAIPVIFGQDETPSAEETSDYLLINKDSMEIEEAEETEAKCARLGRDWSGLPDFISWYNRTLAVETKCRLSLTSASGSPVLKISPDCSLTRAMAGKSRTRGFMIGGISFPYINLSDGLFNSLSDEQIMSVIAHELGHYYHAHGAASVYGDSGEYNYFYRLDQYDYLGKPGRDPNLEAFRRPIVNANLVYKVLQRYKGSTNPDAEPALIWATIHLLPTILERPSAASSCIQLHNFLDVVAKDDGLEISTTEMQELEGHVKSCGTEVIVESTDSDPVSMDEVKNSIDAIEVNLMGYASGTLKEELADDLRAKANLFETLLELGPALKVAESKAGRVLDNAIDLQIGYYTQEQDADDFALELLSLAGAAPEAAVDTVFSLAAQEEEQSKEWKSFPGEISLPECKALRSKGWLDENGLPVIVPVADFLDPHHLACFRAFNMSHRIRAHGYN